MKILLPTYTKQSKVLIQSLIFVGVLLILTWSCKKEDPPTLTTLPVTEITGNTAQSGGNITDDGGASVKASGVVWNTTENPTLEDYEGFTEDGEGTGEFTSKLTGLSPGTAYYVRAYATNITGAEFGSPIEFTTLSEVDGNAGTPVAGTPGVGVTDIDGNYYATVIIGDQEWMAENLKTTKYRNGEDISTELNDSEWLNSTDSTYTIYPHDSITGLNSDAEVLEAYGALYNWNAVKTGNLCPTGWRVPTHAEWTTLTDYLRGRSIAGGKLKSTRTAPNPQPHWSYPNEGATDEYGFSALPGGYRSSEGPFSSIGNNGRWWSATEYSSNYIWIWHVYFNYSIGYDGITSKKNGFSVRCIKDF